MKIILYLQSCFLFRKRNEKIFFEVKHINHEKVSQIISLIILFGSQIALSQTKGILILYQQSILFHSVPIVIIIIPTFKFTLIHKKNIPFKSRRRMDYCRRNSIRLRGYSVYKMLNVLITDYDDENPMQFLNIHRKKYPYTSNGRIKATTVSTEQKLFYLIFQK